MSQLVLLLTLAFLRPGDASAPSVLVLRVARAIEADSAAALRSQLQASLRHSPGARATLFELATLERLTYHPAASRPLYLATLAGDSIPRDPLGVATLIGLALLDLDDGRWDLVRQRLEDAANRAARLGDASLEAEALLDLAPVVVRTTSDLSSDTIFARVAALLPDTAQRLWARLHCARAGPPKQPGELDESEEAMAGVTLARRVGDRRIEAACLSSYAKALFRHSMVDSAIAVNGQAVALDRATRDGAGLAAVLQWQGYALVAAREYGPARRTLLESLDASRISGNWLPAGVALMSLASLSVRFGEMGGARRYANWADSLLQAQGNERSRAGVQAVHGDIARASGDTAGARRAYNAALGQSPRFSGYGSVAPQRGLSALSREGGDWPAAAAHLDTARVVARQLGMKDWARRLDYDAGSLALAQGDITGAEREYNAFLAGLAPGDRALALPARLHLAEIEARRGAVARAESLANAAFDDLDRWRSQMDDRTLRLQAMALRELDLDPGLGLPVIAGAIAAAGRAQAALLLVERERARELAEAQLRLGSWGGMDSPGGRDPLPGHFGAPDSTTAIVEFVIGSATEPTLALLLTRAGVRAVAGPPAAGLGEAVARFRGLVESGADPTRLDRGFTTTLMGSVLDAIPPGVTTLVIVPDGALYRVPFDALRLSDGRLLVERFAVVVAPSVGTTQAIASPPLAAGRTPRVLALANPLLATATQQPPGAETELFRRSFAAAGGLPPLPASEAEARRAARVAPLSTVRLRADASESWLKQAPLEQYTMIHIAAHAVVSDDDLGGSAVALAPGGGEDGFVTAADLAALSLRAELVVLSSCRTAGGVVIAGEGLQGLTAPLLRAGARAVLATGWEVRDRDASRFTDLFYRELERDGLVVTALGRAKRAARAAGMPASVWAGFVLVGNPAARIPKAPPVRVGS